MRNKRIGLLLIIVGVLAILSAGLIWLSNIREENEAATYSESVAHTILEQIKAIPPQDVRPPAITNGTDNNGDVDVPGTDVPGEAQEPVEEYITVEGTAYIGVLSIPALGLDLPVNRSWSYPALRRTPCRFSGDISSNSLVIAAHNYTRHFGKISGLDMGELVMFTTAGGDEYFYQVVNIEVVQPSSTYTVMHSGYDLTLFTCTYGGQARVVLRCMSLASSTGA